MKFSYVRTVGTAYDSARDENYDESYEFEYEPSQDDLENAVAEIYMEQHLDGLHFNQQQFTAIQNMTKELLVDACAIDGLAEEYYDELKDMFEDEAMESESNE